MPAFGRSGTIASVVLLLLLLALWLPFGFRTACLVEEWRVFCRLAAGEFPFEPAHIARPLWPLPWASAYWLCPNDPFLGQGVVMSFLMLAKSLLFYRILRRLMAPHPDVALLASILLMLFPDPGTYSTRTLNIHTAIVLLLAAFLAWLRFLEHPRWPLVPTVTLPLLIGFLTYEGTYPLAIVLPLLVSFTRWGSPIRSPTRRDLAVWYGAVVGCLAYTVYASGLLTSSGVVTYQQRIADTHFSRATLRGMVSSVVRLYAQSYGLAWRPDVATLLADLAAWWTIPVAGAVVVVIALRLIHRPETPLLPREVSVWLLGGLFITLTGFAAYLPTAARHDDWRVYLISAPGTAIGLAVSLSLLRRREERRSMIFMLCTLGLVFLGILRSLSLHSTIHASDLRAMRMMTDVVTAAPRLRSSAVFVFRSAPDPQVVHDAFFYHHAGLAQALSYLYGDSMLTDVVVCNATPHFIHRRCEFAPDHIAVEGPHRPLTLTYDRVVLFDYSPVVGFRVKDAADAPRLEHYEPRRLIDAASRPSERSRTLLGIDAR
jgi:hypothetical protein